MAETEGFSGAKIDHRKDGRGEEPGVDFVEVIAVGFEGFCKRLAAIAGGIARDFGAQCDELVV